MVNDHLRTISLKAIEDVTSNLCTHCLRYKATAADWDTTAEGEGSHLCWEEGYCGWEPKNGLTYESFITDAILAALDKEGVLNYRASAG